MQARGKTVAVILPTPFEAQSYITIRDCMVGAGGQTILVGYKKDEPLTDNQRKEMFTVDISYDEMRLGDFDALLVLDGAGVRDMFESKSTLDFIKQSYEHQKILGAIDHGVELVATALGPLMSRRHVAGPAEIGPKLVSMGAVHSDKDVVIDKLLITAKTNQDAKRFCNALLDMFGEAERRIA